MADRPPVRRKLEFPLDDIATDQEDTDDATMVVPEIEYDVIVQEADNAHQPQPYPATPYHQPITPLVDAPGAPKKPPS